MDDKNTLISHCLDIKKRAADNLMITSTGFLSLDERNILRAIERDFNSEIDTFYCGGYKDCERTVAVFIPKCFMIKDADEYFFENSDDAPFDLIRISKDRFSSLGHRDYLGSIMGLGLKRETVGDIVISDDYAYVYALKGISSYICENLLKAGRGTLNCEICDFSEFVPSEEKTEIVFSSVASLRLDNIVASAFNLSRNSASEHIKCGTVYVNSLQILKNDYTVKEKDKIVLRGKGKVILYEIIGENKKGRIHINIKKYR